MTVLGPGVRVKCVRREPWRLVDELYAPTTGPDLNTLWTIRSYFPGDRNFVFLAEWPDGNSSFGTRNFVPLDGNEDISVFTEMLTKLPAPDKLSAPSKLPATPTLVPAS